MQNIKPLSPALTTENKLETIKTLADAGQLAKQVFLKVSGREVSSLDHMDDSLDSLVMSSLNKHIAGK